MTTIRRTCPKCGGDMSVELLRPDPHDAPVPFLVCPCGYWEAAPPDIEAELEDRPRTSRPNWKTVPGCRDFRR